MEADCNWVYAFQVALCPKQKGVSEFQYEIFLLPFIFLFFPVPTLPWVIGEGRDRITMEFS